MAPTFEMKDEDDIAVASEIEEFFTGISVFVTGATGFLGKLMLEKLLRTCTGIDKVYILVREKKGKSIAKRTEELLDLVLFDPLRRKNPNFANKVIVLPGDCVLPDLGLSHEDQQKLIDNVSCVFHCAATVRFDQTLRTATYINVRATRDLLKFAKQMPKFKSFVYVSTAYSNCVRMDINEEFYEPRLTGDNLLALMDILDDDVLVKATPTLIGDWPNTYAFTKCVAEELVKTHGKGLPIAVLRPSIITGTLKEPLAGWIDNVYGATGIFLGAALGLIRTLYADKKAIADVVPADYVTNCTIATAWDVSTTKASTSDKETTNECAIPTVYNYVSSIQAPITWEETMKLAEHHFTQLPSPLIIWHYTLTLNSNYYLHYLYLILLHRLPAYIVDFIARCLGKEPQMVKGYQKIEKFLDVISYFSTKTWRFRNNNVQALWKKLNLADRKSFEFGLDNFDWNGYFYTLARGGRVYLLKDPLDTLPQGRVKYRKLQIAHYVLVSLLVLGLIKLFMIIWSAIF